jgi:hypothetical protein
VLNVNNFSLNEFVVCMLAGVKTPFELRVHWMLDEQAVHVATPRSSAKNAPRLMEFQRDDRGCNELKGF